MARRPSAQTLAVLGALARDPHGWRHGYELGLEVGLQAGTLYPILMRLADRGLLEASWEPDPPVGRPRRHLYRIVAAGSRLAESAAVEAVAARSAPSPRSLPRARPAPSQRSVPRARPATAR